MTISHYDRLSGWVKYDPLKIQYIVCENKYKEVTYINGESLLTEQSLCEIVELNSFILRTHRKYAVNMNFIRLVDKEYLTMNNGVRIPISRRYSKLVNEVLS